MNSSIISSNVNFPPVSVGGKIIDCYNIAI